VLAWSTIGQVGFMFLALGAGNVAGSMFHLLTHACFKALLFLGAGCIIRALGEEQDIYRMGAGVRKALPQVFWAFVLGALALAAVPPFSGFFSKGEILLSALGSASAGFRLVWLLGLAASLLTVLYTFRMLLLVFFGGPLADKPAESEDIPGPMIQVLWPLALLSLLAGGLNLPGAAPWSRWLADLLSPLSGPFHHPQAHAALWHMTLEIGLSLAGILIAVALYGPASSLGRRHPAMPGVGLQGLLLEGFKVDRLYRLAVARPYQALAGLLWRDVDERLVDGTAERAGRLMTLASSGVRLWTTGRISTYLCMLLAGLVLILLLILAAGAWNAVPL
jgi:NADH-quinone oxidoreductase subunit L